MNDFYKKEVIWFQATTYELSHFPVIDKNIIYLPETSKNLEKNTKLKPILTYLDHKNIKNPEIKAIWVAHPIPIPSATRPTWRP